MKIQNFVVSFIFLLSTTTYAVEATQKFASKEDCFKNFVSTTGNNSAGAAETFCKDKYVILKSPVDVCADKKLLDFKMKNSISSLEEPKYMIKFKNECIKLAQADAQKEQEAVQQYQQQTQLAQQQAQIVAQQQAAQQAANDAKKRQDSQASLQQTGALLQAVIPIAGQVERAYDSSGGTKAVTREPTGSTGGALTPTTSAPVAATLAPSANTQSTTPTLPAGYGVLPRQESQEPSYGYNPNQLARNEYVTAESQATPKSPYDGMSSEQLKSESERLDTQLKADKAALKNQVDGVTEVMPDPEVKKATSGVEAAAAAGESVTPPVSEITAISQAVTKKLAASLEGSVTKLNAIYDGNSIETLANPNTKVLLEPEIKTILEKYATKDKSYCTWLTEKTELLCLERTSPGWVAAKTLVNVSSPILAIVNSTQKACSNTSKITALAGTALTVAKGVCMSSQLACLTMCSSAKVQLQTEISALVAKAQAAQLTDMEVNESMCAALQAAATAAAATPAGPAAAAKVIKCKQEILTKSGATKTTLAELNTIAKTEAAPTPGTAAGLSAKCNMKITDTLIMAANIASLVLAKKSADECDRKLAAAGAAGANVSQTQFCETPANVATQFCKCQKNANQMGCPGFNASNDDLNKKDLAGTNLKGAGGVSAFASSGKSKTNFAGNGGLVGDNLKTDGSAVQASGSGSSEGGQTAGSGAFGGAGSDRASAFGSAASDAANGDLAEKKKWSFGSFANSVGNLFGGRGSKNSGANGGLSSKQESAIQRKIASDKLADEVTSASGKSNWEKVHRLYSIKENTLMSGN